MSNSIAMLHKVTFKYDLLRYVCCSFVHGGCRFRVSKYSFPFVSEGLTELLLVSYLAPQLRPPSV